VSRVAIPLQGDPEKRRLWWKQYHTWVGVVASGLLVAVCYGFSLQLPFFFDDLPIMTWLNLHGWPDIWAHSSENAYYRPLAFTVYKLGDLFPLGTRQVVLRSVNLAIHWLNAVLIMQLVKLCGKGSVQAVLAAMLSVVFPFVYLAVPWITALSHPMVIALTLVAAYGALRAERDSADTDHASAADPKGFRKPLGSSDGGASRAAWWGLSLLATALAPFAHESGPICSVIVGGWVIIRSVIPPQGTPFRWRAKRTALAGVILGVLLNVGGVLVRSYVPGVGDMQLAGLREWPQSTVYFLHGLVYPVAPVIGWLVNHHGAHDLTLVKIATAGLGLLLAGLTRRSRDWRYVACALWWWACGAVPAAVSLRFNYLYISPRLHALSSAGVVMLWAYIIFELGRLARRATLRHLVWGLLAAAIVVQNSAFLARQRALFTSLNHVYQEVLEAAADADNAPLGFVNVPDALAWREKTYALVQENVIFVPWYSGTGEFIEVNQGWRPSDTVRFTPVLQDTEQVFGSQGQGLDWEQMRQFATEHRTVWLARYEGERFVLNQVGTVAPDSPASTEEPLVRFEGGPVIESASVRELPDGRWALALTWYAPRAGDLDVFVHVRDASGNVVAQADGPALGGMVPMWIWQPGDRVHDIRHFALPGASSPTEAGPYTVQVGLYDDTGRSPAFMDGHRCAEDAAPVATLVP